MQYDPSTGRGYRFTNDQLMTFPAVNALGDTALDGLLEATRFYLLAETDYSETWLGTDHHDKRAWTGYLGLVLFHDNHLLDGLPDDIWTHWCGSIVWFPAVALEAGNRERKADLLKRATKHAPDALAHAFVTYVKGEIGRGAQPWDVQSVDPTWAPELSSAMKTLANEIAQALDQHEASSAPSETETSPPADGTAGQPTTAVTLQRPVRNIRTESHAKPG